MTAQTTADIRETCRKAGMDDYIAKPIREEELAKVIRKSWKAKKSVMLCVDKEEITD